MQRYQDRTEAGWRLAVHFAEYYRHPEVLVLAISRGGVQVAYEIAQALEAELDLFLITNEEGETVRTDVGQEAKQQGVYYRNGDNSLSLKGRIVILVDDGLSAASIVRTAAKAVRGLEPAQMIIAIPVLSAADFADFSSEVDRTVCAVSPKPFQAAGFLYKHAEEPTDREIRNMIERAARQQESASILRAPRR